MGGVYTLYGRKKDTEKYVSLQELEEHQMNLFKHNVVAYAQDKKHTDLKSLYLYKGYLRMAKAIVRGGYLEITFYSAAFASEWDSSEESVNDIPWLFRDFCIHWKPVHTDYNYMRVYQKI